MPYAQKLSRAFARFLPQKKDPEPNLPETYRNSFLGRRCFILGNGPSLRMEDIERLRWEVTFASNKIYLCFDQTSWRPTFYCVEDGLVFRQNLEKLKSLEDMTCFYPLGFYDSLGPHPNRFFFRAVKPRNMQDPLANPGFPGFSRNPPEKICWGSSIIYTQIQLAVFMGFRQIFLLGVDHHYILPTQSIGNYYISEGESNHFLPNYRQAGEKWYRPQLHVLAHSFAKAGQVCAALGVDLLNASRKTKLEALPRISLEEALKSN